MKKLVHYFLTVSLVAAVALAVFNHFIEHGLQKQKEDVFAKLHEIFLGKENFDVLFLGSSRIIEQVNPHIIDSVLKVKSFNAGFYAINIVACSMIFNSYLENHTPPKILVLNLDWNTLQVTDTTILSDYALYFPYLNDKNVSHTMNEFVPSFSTITFLPFLKPAYYDDFKKYMAFKSILNPQGSQKNIFFKGYIPKHLEWGGEHLKSALKPSYSLKGIDLMKQILNSCREKNIKVILVYPPQTNELTEKTENFTEYKTLLKEIGNSENALFYDYTEMKGTADKNYFYDHTHLNSKGADIYSLQLANDLSQLPVVTDTSEFDKKFK